MVCYSGKNIIETNQIYFSQHSYFGRSRNTPSNGKWRTLILQRNHCILVLNKYFPIKRLPSFTVQYYRKPSKVQGWKFQGAVCKVQSAKCTFLARKPCTKVLQGPFFFCRDRWTGNLKCVTLWSVLNTSTNILQSSIGRQMLTYCRLIILTGLLRHNAVTSASFVETL